jgi:hypothetical protein
MFRGGRRAPLPHTGWRPDNSGRYDLRYYVDGVRTDRVGTELVDDTSGTAVQGFGCHLASRNGRLVVVAAEAGLRVSLPLARCRSVRVADDEEYQAVRFELEVRAGGGHATTSLVLRFPPDCRAELDRIAASAGGGEHVDPDAPPYPVSWSAEGLRSACGAERGEPIALEPTALEPADDGRGEHLLPGPVPEPEPAALPRLDVRRVPDTDEWTSFGPLASSADVLAFDDRAERWAGGEVDGR